MMSMNPFWHCHPYPQLKKLLVHSLVHPIPTTINKKTKQNYQNEQCYFHTMDIVPSNEQKHTHISLWMRFDCFSTSYIHKEICQSNISMTPHTVFETILYIYIYIILNKEII